MLDSFREPPAADLQNCRAVKAAPLPGTGSHRLGRPSARRMIWQPPEQMTNRRRPIAYAADLSFVICYLSFRGHDAFKHLPHLRMVQCMACIGYDSGRFRQLN
jgi:hypothetical protein